MSISEILLTFISKELKPGLNIEVDTSLFEARRLDSMHLAELLAFIDETFRVRLPATDIAVENFDTVQRISSLIERRRP